MTKVEFAALLERHDYYRGRALYMSMAARLADQLVRSKGLRTTLELGPHLRPLVTGADVIDISDQPLLDGARGRILHDATSTPWPVDDHAYDLFVALQVFEHLRGGQEAAFAEVCRVARNAIISLPIEWVMADPTDCHHMLTSEQVLAWFAPRVPNRIVAGNPAPGMRLIYVFTNLDRPVPQGRRTPPPIEFAPA